MGLHVHACGAHTIHIPSPPRDRQIVRPQSQPSLRPHVNQSVRRPATATSTRSMSTRSMMGAQSSSMRRSSPSFSFGSSNRAGAAKVYTDRERSHTSDTPGPVYSLRPSIGIQVEGRLPTAPSTGFSTSERFPRPRTAGAAPGPGAYSHKGTFGRQVRRC